MKLSLKLSLAGLVGIFIGMALSDVASSTGFPFQKHLVETHFDGSAESAFLCSKRASILGQNLSTLDHRTKRQENCLIEAHGFVGQDGTYHGRLGWYTWHGRVSNLSFTLDIPAKDIKAVRPS